MTDDLIADLKAAHEAATAQLAGDDFHSAGWHRRNAANGRLEELMRKHAAEIIAALEERERLREKIRVMSLYLRHNEWCAIYRNLHCTCGLDVQLAALDALEGRR